MPSKLTVGSTVRFFSASRSRFKDARTRYILPMFPYPSGRLHLGHLRVYSISDVLAQYYRLNGYNVLHPIAWDSFGLPAENAARSMGVEAADWTAKNVETMRDQLKQTGIDFDWDREFSTCNPDYYRWTQWIFVKLFERDLVHRRFASVNWDPVDETVLAAEQIDANQRSWRSGALVEKRKLKQWAVETPRYAKRLFDGIQTIKQDWQEVAAIQANWIGKCDVYRFMFPVYENNQDTGEFLDLRLLDPVELSRAEFVVLCSDHPLAPQKPSQHYASSKFVVNFLNNRPLPVVFLALDEQEQTEEDFIMKARLGFTAKSAFDKSLANKLKIQNTSTTKELDADLVLEKAVQAGAGGYQTSRILQDWVVSRQRAWGTPIPIIIDAENDEQCRPVPVNLLPVLPEQRGQLMSKNGRIEVDTLDTFFDSSWYYLRYLDPHNNQELANLSKIEEFMPVDVYVGGIEHADVHLFFARFMSHFLYDIGVTTTPEPFQRLLPQGMVRGRTFVELSTGRYVHNDDVEKAGENEWRSKGTGKSLETVYEKMSKSKANGVDPLKVIGKVGTDLARLQLLSLAAPRATLDWDDNDYKGLQKWIERMEWVVNTYVEQRRFLSDSENVEMVSSKRESYYRENYNYFVRNVSTCIEVFQLHNTAIARLQGLTNALRKMEVSEAGRSAELERCVFALVIMLQAFAPKTAQKFWDKLQTVTPIRTEAFELGGKLCEQKWPTVDVDAEIDFAVMIMDTSCARVTVPRETVEHLSDVNLIEAAQNYHHKALFKLISSRGININSIRVSRHPGFHVTLYLDVPETVTEEKLSKLLNELANEKHRARKEAKKQRNKIRIAK